VPGVERARVNRMRVPFGDFVETETPGDILIYFVIFFVKSFSRFLATNLSSGGMTILTASSANSSLASSSSPITLAHRCLSTISSSTSQYFVHLSFSKLFELGPTPGTDVIAPTNPLCSFSSSPEELSLWRSSPLSLNGRRCSGYPELISRGVRRWMKMIRKKMEPGIRDVIKKEDRRKWRPFMSERQRG